MGEEDIYDVPEDVVEEVIEEEEKPKQGARKSKYPTQGEIAEAVRTTALTYNGEPTVFPEAVLSYLEEQGFSVKHVSVKRIWRTYEKLVRTGRIGDVLGVMYD
ncbi:MAG: hypothetical protein F7B59_06790 [Desulfurococcales archaeon]|nr:hypothetical protein [Desulfurococcales archaeon]